MKAKVDINKCVGCGACARICPRQVITIKDGKAIIDDGCTACGACVRACPVGAILL